MTQFEFPELVVAPDTEITPVAELPPNIRELMNASLGDHCVTRRGTRSASIVVNSLVVQLLTHFRHARPLVDAVLEFSQTAGEDPHSILDAAFPALATLSREGLLVAAGATGSQPIAATFRAGDSLAEFEIEDAVRILDDTEVYRAVDPDGNLVAIKIAGAAATSRANESIRHEAAILKHMARHASGAPVPTLVAMGLDKDRPYLATTWHWGVDLYEAAADARALLKGDQRKELLNLAVATAGAYARLHQTGVIHIDVHPRNVLVGPLGEITLLDFGLAAVPSAGWTRWRGGMDFFLAPEIAQARLCGESPAASFAAEVYSVGALIHFLLTGRHTHRFSLRPDEMLRQLIEDPILPFEDDPESGLVAVEECLRRAMAKDPSARFASIQEFFEDLQALNTEASDGPAVEAHIVDQTVRRLSLSGEMFRHGLDAPKATLTYGGAGVAYALLRLSVCRADAGLLAAADAWAEHALVDLIRDPGAVWNERLGIVPETFGSSSLFHHEAGVHLVRALVARARDDDWTFAVALEDFIRSSRTTQHLDIGFGRSGLLIGCALLCEAYPDHLEQRALIDAGDELFGNIWNDLQAEPPITAGTRHRLLGVAHGWAGFLYALLRWCIASGRPVPAELKGRVDELADLAEPIGRAYRWPREVGAPADDSILTASWCNGAAGQSHLFGLAHRIWREDRHRQLAIGACWTAYNCRPDVLGDLCCGLAGRAYALLAQFQRSGDPMWLARAASLAQRAADEPDIPKERKDSLFHGEPGIAVLIADVNDPINAAMPLFGL
jgi:eukaryotic-like serine/threonine-protein kinase